MEKSTTQLKAPELRLGHFPEGETEAGPPIAPLPKLPRAPGTAGRVFPAKTSNPWGKGSSQNAPTALGERGYKHLPPQQLPPQSW